jgi:hypothetical protein
MNTQLEEVITNAEGRYLNEDEAAIVREFAMHMTSRLDAVQRLADREEEVVTASLSELGRKHPDAAELKDGDSQERLAEHLRLALRYMAQAHVRDDELFFRRAYAEWTAEMLTAMFEPDFVADIFGTLDDVLRERMDAIDSQVFARYLDVFTTEIRRWA